MDRAAHRLFEPGDQPVQVGGFGQSAPPPDVGALVPAEAAFEIVNRSREPDWWPAAGVKIPFGHPDNILGSRWLGFKNTPELSGFGIHGTSDPSSIGRNLSSGCIRMHEEDIERLFEWTPLETKVLIRR